MQPQPNVLNRIASWVLSQYKTHLLWTTAVIFTFGTGYALYQPVHPDPWHVHDGWDRFLYPQEKNAFLRQPSISHKINHVTSIKNHLWAVGAGGLILHSIDGGRCWTPQGPWIRSVGETLCPQQKTGLQRIFSGLSASVDTNRLLNSAFPGAYAGVAPNSKQPKIVEKQNNPPPKTYPAQEIEQKSIPEEPAQSLETIVSNQAVKNKGVTENASIIIPNLKAVAFYDKNLGIAVGSGGVIVSTKDGGESWAFIESRTQDRLNAIAFSSNNQAIAVGDSGAILRSSDGGTSWVPKKSGTGNNLRSISFSTNDKVLIVGSHGAIMRSRDGGESWVSVKSGVSERLYSIAFSSNKQAIAVGENGAILRSSDGGKSWEPAVSGTQETLYSITFTSNEQAIAVGFNGVMLRSGDGGESWDSIESGTQDWLKSITFSSNNRGVVVSEMGNMLLSTDGGESWAVVSDRRNQLNAIAFSRNKNLAIIVSDSGNMLRSNDRGESWVTVESGTQNRLRSIAFSNNNQAVAVGDNGSILHSSDGGESWASIESGTQNRLRSIAFSNNNQAISVGDKGSILRSSDGGKSWLLVESTTQDTLTSIAFSDYNQAIAVGDNGSLLRSTNGGEFWVPVRSTTPFILTSIAFSNNNQAIAVGQLGTILRSSDGGKSWYSIKSGTQEWLTSIAFSSNNQIIIVGKNGTMLRSSDSGKSWISVKSDTRDDLNAIAFSSDNQSLTVGENGSILHSSDSGESWTRINHYSVSLPLWWYVFIIFTAGLVLMAVWPRISPAEDDGIAGLAASDKPLQPGDPDALNLNGIALDITAFLSNPKTTAPLTMAITGPWGSGKSSLMNLIKADLQQRGFSPVWFNAWHHQKGEQLLASLFAHIKQQAIPSCFSFDGLWFRLKLAFIRTYQHWFMFVIMLGLLFFTLSFYKQAIITFLLDASLLSDPKQWWLFPWAEYTPSFQNLFREGDWMQALASIFGIGTPLVALVRSVRGFGINPSKLVSIDHSPDNKKGYDPGARARFAREFNDVTHALGNNKMVIFIDDLDRCSQDNLIDILENINFISSSGDCFLIVGMAPKYIEACVANAYETLAQSIAEKELHEHKNHIDDKQTHKFRFAHNYLEKMINIEVAIPEMQANSIDQLFNLQEAETDNKPWKYRLYSAVQQVIKSLNIILPVFIILLAIGHGWEYGRRIPDKPSPEKRSVIDLGRINQHTLMELSQKQSGKAITERLLSAKNEDQKPDDLTDFSIAIQADKIQMEEGLKIASIGQGKDKAYILLKFNPLKEILETVKSTESRADSPTPGLQADKQANVAAEFRQATSETSARISGFKLLFGLLLFSSFAYYLYKKKRDKYADDSDDFKTALKTWTPWIQLKQETPRSVKRFLNHLRFLAIRNNKELNESELVAMAAIYFYNPTWLLDEKNFARLYSDDFIELLKHDFQYYELDDKDQNYLLTALIERTKKLSKVLQSVDFDSLSAIRGKALNILKGSLPESSGFGQKTKEPEMATTQ